MESDKTNKKAIKPKPETKEELCSYIPKIWRRLVKPSRVKIISCNSMIYNGNRLKSNEY